LGVPMLDQNGRVIGHIATIDDKPMARDERAIDLSKIFASRAAAELKRQRAETELQAALEQVRDLQKKLEAENVYLQEEIGKEHNFEEIVGNSKGLLEVLRRVETIAPTDSTVLILGETGSGKELIARAIHNRSKRKSRPLVKVNCGAIPTGQVESELFGHMKGAFTGALERRIGSAAPAFRRSPPSSWTGSVASAAIRSPVYLTTQSMCCHATYGQAIFASCRTSSNARLFCDPVLFSGSARTSCR